MDTRMQRGFTLVDGLVALTVLLFGVVGLLRLQTTVIQHNMQSRYRVQAAYMAEELVALAQADSGHAGCYATTDGTAPTCPSPIAQAAVTDWIARIEAALPGAAALHPTVTYDAATGDFAVTVAWQRPPEPVAHRFVGATNIYAGP